MSDLRGGCATADLSGLESGGCRLHPKTQKTTVRGLHTSGIP